MENKLRVGLIAGVIAGVVCFAYLFMLHSLDLNPFGQYKSIYYGIYGAFFAPAMWYFRDKLNAYRLRAQQGIMIGFVLNAVASAVFGLTILLFLNTIGQSALDLHIEQSLNLLQQSKEFVEAAGEDVPQLSPVEYEKTYKSIQNLSPKELALDQMIWMFAVGIFHTLLFMLMMKN